MTTTDNNNGSGVAYLIRERGGSRINLAQAVQGRFRWAGEYWQQIGSEWGWGPIETARYYTEAEREEIDPTGDGRVHRVGGEWVTVLVGVPAQH